MVLYITLDLAAEPLAYHFSYEPCAGIYDPADILTRDPAWNLRIVRPVLGLSFSRVLPLEDFTHLPLIYIIMSLSIILPFFKNFFELNYNFYLFPVIQDTVIVEFAERHPPCYHAFKEAWMSLLHGCHVHYAFPKVVYV